MGSLSILLFYYSLGFEEYNAKCKACYHVVLLSEERDEPQIIQNNRRMSKSLLQTKVPILPLIMNMRNESGRKNK